MVQKLIPLVLALVALFLGCTRSESPDASSLSPTAAALAQQGEHVIKGRVLYSNRSEKLLPIRMSGDPECVKSNGGKDNMPNYLLMSEAGELQNTFVHVKEGVKGVFPPPTQSVRIDQEGCRYRPHVLGVRVGQPIEILNSDPTLHNVNVKPKFESGFNRGMAAKTKIDTVFKKPEIGMKFRCDVHNWMAAYVSVVEHPYFAVTDAKGSFVLSGLPAGTYVVEAWHETAGTRTATVTLENGKPDSPVDFTF